MGKAKGTAVAAVAALALLGGGIAVSKAANDTKETAAATQPAAPLNLPANWLEGYWVGTADFGKAKPTLVLHISPGPGGMAQGELYTPDYAVGSRRGIGITSGPDGAFNIPIPIIEGGYTGRAVAPDKIVGNWTEGGEMRTELIMTRTNTPPARRMPPPRQEVSVAPDVLRQYAGVYGRSAEDLFPIELRNGQLYGSMRFSEPFPLYAESPTKFFSKEADTQFEFIRDPATGVVTSVVRTEPSPDGPKNYHFRKVQ